MEEQWLERAQFVIMLEEALYDDPELFGYASEKHEEVARLRASLHQAIEDLGEIGDHLHPDDDHSWLEQKYNEIDAALEILNKYCPPLGFV